MDHELLVHWVVDDFDMNQSWLAYWTMNLLLVILISLFTTPYRPKMTACSVTFSTPFILQTQLGFEAGPRHNLGPVGLVMGDCQATI